MTVPEYEVFALRYAHLAERTSCLGGRQLLFREVDADEAHVRIVPRVMQPGTDRARSEE